MNYALQFKASQQLSLSPQVQQLIHLLQLSTQELNGELERYLAENPLLERDEPESGPLARPSAAEGGEPEAVKLGSTEAPPWADGVEIDVLAAPGESERDDDEDAELAPQSPCVPSLAEHLRAQLGMTRLSARDKALVHVLIAALDERGYLSESLEEIAGLLPAELEVEPAELEVALKYLQRLDPAGVGARTLAECLELQLVALPRAARGRELAIRIVRDHLGELAARDFGRLKRMLGCDDASLREAQLLIRSLNPNPGAQHGEVGSPYIVPDVVVRKVRNAWVASLNPDALPKLRINRMYADILQDTRHAGASPMASRLQEARWLIRSVQQRFDTILRVAQAIAERQVRFFEYGDLGMRPLMQREIAEVLGLHRSTVSRASANKYMSTPRGIFELRHFFCGEVSTETGSACSATAIRSLIRELIATEDHARPLSDCRIAEILVRHGIVLARRTVSKYRDAMHLPPANLRRLAAR